MMWWQILLLAIFLIFLKSRFPSIRGRIGENLVTDILKQLDSNKYLILNDLMLSSSGNIGLTQIDHVVVSNFGIFVIETKAYKGWIFGNPYDKYWTQVIYRYKHKFFNPMRQNFAHIKAVEAAIHNQYPAARVYGFVVLPFASKIQVNAENQAGGGNDLFNMILNHKTEIISQADRDNIFQILLRANIGDKDLRKIHDQGVRRLIEQ